MYLILSKKGSGDYAMGDEPTLSGEFILPDGTSEFWWNGKCYGNVVPEEIIDEALAFSKEKENENGGMAYEKKR